MERGKGRGRERGRGMEGMILLESGDGFIVGIEYASLGGGGHFASLALLSRCELHRSNFDLLPVILNIFIYQTKNKI